MLFISFKPNSDGRPALDANWEYGTPRLTSKMSGTEIDAFVDKVREVQANDRELNVILENITGLPVVKGKSEQSWFGDHAKFIVRNYL